MSFLDDARRVGKSRTLAIALVVGMSLTMASVGPAQATPSTPVTDDCWSCGFDLTDSAYDDSGFSDDLSQEWPYSRFFEQPREFNGGFGRLGWRKARPSWQGRFGARRWAGRYRARWG